MTASKPLAVHLHIYKDGTPAHVFERVFGCLTQAAGYKITGFARNKKFERHSRWRRILRFFYSSDITSHQYLLAKVCKIPVYHKKIDHRAKEE